MIIIENPQYEKFIYSNHFIICSCSLGDSMIYQCITDENPIIYRDTEFDGIILKSDFKDFLYYHLTLAQMSRLWFINKSPSKNFMSTKQDALASRR